MAGIGSVEMAKSNEPIWWSLFSAGGMVAAMIFPILIIITGILVPFGLAGDDPLNFEKISTGISNQLIKLILFTIITLPLFHWAHRFRFTLVDVGLKSMSTLISILCYGGAIAGTIVSAVVFWNI
jgi:fumarate reductase subunit D|tara:strand:+ start:617 stop:991 length:375 start_codon:yes stop_codon:yes gene_type:complete